ncbi:putative rna polymerase i subunit [Phaeomoniella chlamydospora]|uniref:DNA-directed RNA polymerase subunit n=1 Tax=Phaeomoniella chlamydospora TaxID=158046 RepID=A0A0G2EKC8_PHACM|nr:putative rna polymerase i subunit [Phaeomoniella chlamydospora]
MSDEAGADAQAVSPIPTEKVKKKRKHADDERSKSSKKKRKHTSEEPAQEIEHDEPVTATAIKAQKKEKNKKKKEISLLSPETSPSKLKEDRLESQESHEATSIPEKTSMTPPPSQSQNVELGSVEGRVCSPFFSKRASQLVPLPPIAISTSTALSSLVAQHISPLLLAYHPPLESVILSFSDPVLSSKEPSDVDVISPEPRTANDPSDVKELPLAHSRDEHGVSFIWLTVTFLLFAPNPGDVLEGYVNVASRGHVGLMSYNVFQVSVHPNRIPKSWEWIEPEGVSEKKKPKTTKLRDEDSSPAQSEDTPADSDADQAFETAPEDNIPAENKAAPIEETGYFIIKPSNEKVLGPIKYRVIDIDMVPGLSSDKWSLQLHGTLLNDEAEATVREEERQRWERAERQRKEGPRLQQSSNDKHRTTKPADDEDITMTGALGPKIETPVKGSSKKHKSRKA